MKVKTSVQALNNLLLGGFKIGSLNLVYGKPGVGKTTMMMSIIPDFISKEGEALVVDTEQGWAEERLKQILEKRKCSKGINSTKLYRATSMAEQHKIITKTLDEDIESNDWSPKVIIVDSMVAYYHSQLLEVPMAYLATKARELQGKLSVEINSLLKIASSYEAVVLVTTWTKSGIGEKIGLKEKEELLSNAKAGKPIEDIEGAFGAIGYGFIGGQHLAYMAKSIIRISPTNISNITKAVILEKALDAPTPFVSFINIGESGVQDFNDGKVFPLGEAIAALLSKE
ncbi:MAG: AAA family ATPase [Thermoproteota archaeon]|nr:AAA family ATPase [Candidatus Brockarchaeota archaeon]